MNLNKDSRFRSLQVLNNVLIDKKNLKYEFNKYVSGLSLKDTSFIKFLTYGVIRKKKTLDRNICDYYNGDYSKTSEIYKNYFRLGFYQISCMNSIPDYASVNSTVEIAKKESLKFSRMVNAILMSFIRDGGKIKQIKGLLNYSKSIENILIENFSKKDILKICNWDDKSGEVWFRIKEDVAKKVDKLIDIKISKVHRFLNNYIALENSQYAINEYVKKKNLLEVQSPGAGLVVKLLNIVKNDKVLDACAAPGGKSKYIYEIMKGKGNLWLNDKSHSRCKLLKNSFKDKKVNITSKDATLGTFSIMDKILIDTPCSCSGTIQKNPDIRWKNINIKKLVESQYALLEKLSHAIRIGGAIVYSTCSIYSNENWQIIDKFLKLNSDFLLDDASQYIDSCYVDSNGCLSVSPLNGEMEGVFGARLIRV